MRHDNVKCSRTSSIESLERRLRHVSSVVVTVDVTVSTVEQLRETSNDEALIDMMTVFLDNLQPSFAKLVNS